jgi:hypothetical protein
MATHPAYVSQHALVVQEKRARHLEVSQAMRWLCILVAIFLVGLLYVGLTSGVNTLGAGVQAMRDQKVQLENQNEELRLKAAQLSELKYIAEQAQRLGMVPVTQVEYWKVPTAQATTPGAVPTSAAKAQTRP